jgi:signal transduction histidine kinase
MTRRLLWSYLTVTLFVLVVLEVPFGAFVADRRRQELATGLERDALVLATIYEDALDRNAPYTPDPVMDYATASGTRVVVVDADGISIVDSQGALNQDFTNREEVARALTGEITSGRRRSETLGRDLLFVAVPVASGGRVYGAVRITADPADVESTIHRFWWTLAGVAVVVLAAIALVGWVIARSIARPIRDVQEAAVRAGAGDLDIELERGDAPAELGDLVDRFNEMAARLRELIAGQRAFVGDASHQLRTPLTALRLRLENLEEEVDSGSREDVRAALEEVDRLGRLVSQLLALARSEETVVPVEPVDLVAQARDRCELWSALAEEQHVRITAELGGRAVLAGAVPGAVEQILDNLIENALAVSPPRSEVVVRVEPGSSEHRVHVIDAGPGMSDEDRARAFDRFWRSDTTRHGTGLGLAIVRRLAEASGGSAELLPTPHGGLDAVVTLMAVRPGGRTEATSRGLRAPSEGQ